MNEDFADRRNEMQQHIERANASLLRAAVGVVGAARRHREDDASVGVALDAWDRAWETYVVAGIEMAAATGWDPHDDTR
jgi:hypothetical protein